MGLRYKCQAAVDVVAAIWTTETDPIFSFIEQSDFQTFMKEGSGNTLFLVVSTQDHRTFFATGLFGYMFHDRQCDADTSLLSRSRSQLIWAPAGKNPNNRYQYTFVSKGPPSGSA